MQLWAGKGVKAPLHPLTPPESAPLAPWKESPGPQAADPSCPFPTSSSLGTLQVGEDVPDARKCACASHVAKVAEFFQVRVGLGLVGAGSLHWLVVVMGQSHAA